MVLAPFDKPSAGFARNPNSRSAFRHARSLQAGIQGKADGFPLEECENDNPEVCAPCEDSNIVVQGERKISTKRREGIRSC
jgi:hypothetical protein